MKKFIAGFIAGALIFCAVPAFADSIQNLLGAKVTGVYTIQTQHGEKLAEGAVLNGSAYVPVRAISEATGAALVVDSKKKVITLGEVQGATDSLQQPGNQPAVKPEDIPESVKIKLRESLKEAEQKLDMLNEKLNAAKSEKSTDNSGYIKLLNDRITETTDNIAELKAKLGQ